MKASNAQSAAIVTRRLVLAQPAPQGGIEAFSRTNGVISIAPSQDGKQLAVTYDVRVTAMDELVKAAIGNGLQPSNGLLARLGRQWSAFQDENLRSHSKVVHQCCSTPPK